MKCQNTISEEVKVNHKGEKVRISKEYDYKLIATINNLIYNSVCISDLKAAPTTATGTKATTKTKTTNRTGTLTTFTLTPATPCFLKVKV